MLKHNGTIFNAHRYATTVDRSVSGVHVIQEYTDNSIQYGSKEVMVIVDSHKNQIITMDIGTGIAKDIFCTNYHTFHNEPKDTSGISMAGLGSKLFYKLSDTRVTITRHNGTYYYSTWDFSSKESFAKPVIDYLDTDNIPEELRDHEDIIKRFVSIDHDGTTTILPNIKTWGKYGTSSLRFFNALREYYANRYGHFLHTNKLTMAVSYVDNKDKREWFKISSANIFNSTSYNSAFNKAGNIEVRSWIVEPNKEQAKLTKCGINIYRNDVKAVTNHFLKIGQRKKKGQSISVVKAAPHDHKSIRQIVFFNSESDDEFVINHIKTQIEFGDEIEQLCASEFTKIVEQYEKQQQEAQQEKVAEAIEEDTSLVFTIEELAAKTAWKMANGQISFNKSSKVYSTIESLPTDGIDLIKSLLASIPSRQVNQLGKTLENNIGGDNV